MRDSPSCDNMVTFLMISDHCFILFSFLPNFFIYFQEFIVKFYHISFKITISLNNFIKYFSSIQYFFVIFISCMWLYHQYKSFYTVKASDLFIFLFQRRRDINKEPARRAFCVIEHYGVIFYDTKKARKQLITVFMLLLSYIILLYI